jgi:hypothetical protein
VWLLAILIAAAGNQLGCGDAAADEAAANAARVESVRKVMDPKSVWASMDPGTKSASNGAGTIVSFGRAVYLVKGTEVYAITEEAKKCSPKVPVTKEVKASELEL